MSVVWVSTEQASVALSVDDLAKSKAAQYVRLGESRAVSDRAADILGEPGAGTDLRETVTVTNPSETAQLNVEALADTPTRAQSVAQAWSQAMAEVVNELEFPDGTDSATADIRVNSLVEPDLPQGPDSPNLAIYATTGAVLGLLAGLTAALLRTMLDKRIRSVDALRSLSSLPVIAQLPRLRDQADKNTYVLHPESSDGGSKQSPLRFRQAEAYKELRTNIRFANPDNPPRVLVVTSALPGEGKSTVAGNLALSLAQAGVPVTLIDADLRRPVQAARLGLLPDVGLSDVVLGDADPTEVVQVLDGQDYFDFLAPGALPPNPAEFLSSDRFREQIEFFAEAGMVILDTPPVLAVTDAAILAAQSDGVLLVTDVASTHTRQVREALAALERVNAPLLGLVANRVPVSKRHTHQYGYYSAR